MKKVTKVIIISVLVIVVLAAIGIILFNFSEISSYQAGRTFGIICGVSCGLLIAYALLVFTKKDSSVKCKFDERQELIRGRGYKLSFYTIFGYLSLMLICTLLGVPIPADQEVIYGVGVLATISVYIVYTIINGGYYALNENRKTLVVSFSAIALFNYFIAFVNLINGRLWVNGKVSIRILNFLCGVVMTVTVILTLVRIAKDKKESDNEES